MLAVDYVVVGSGLTGATIARELVDAGREVLVIERRPHLGGNVYDHVHPSGIRIHTYGPHYFRTGSTRIWEFVNRFGSFEPYEAVVKSWVEGAFENWPVSGSLIRRRIGESWVAERQGQPGNLEEAALGLMPRLIYELFVKDYNEKQWGVPATLLSPQLCRRFEIHHDDDPRLKPHHRFQGIPSEGYAAFMARVLSGIPVLLGVDYLRDRSRFSARKLLVFTGPIDEFFDYDLGRLAYRGQIRHHDYNADVSGYVLPCGQVNYPRHADGSLIRKLEWKHMMPRRFADRITGSVVTSEVPYSPERPEDFEYPFPDEANHALFERYQQRMSCLQGVLICGRLGEYRYLDMDQAIGRAMVLARQILDGGR